MLLGYTDGIVTRFGALRALVSGNVFVEIFGKFPMYIQHTTVYSFT